ncbi:MAG: hypothetical protein IPJ37_16550 [Bacteroidales bacterium]|nr:hypothetical protein [Bacteroidales bacterium]
MKITVNNTPLELHEGAKVQDAIVKYYSHSGKKVPVPLPAAEDRYGNTIAHDGELTDGNAIFLKTETGMPLPSVVFVLLGLGLLCACGTGKKAASASQAEKEAVIFAVNDMHATIDNFPKLAWIVDSLRMVYPGMLLVAAGDNQTGNPVNDQFRKRVAHD